MRQQKRFFLKFLFIACVMLFFDTRFIVVRSAHDWRTTRARRELQTVIILRRASCYERNKNKYHNVHYRKMLWQIHSVFLRSSSESVEFNVRLWLVTKSIKGIWEDWCLLSEIMKIPIKWLINKNKTVSNRTEFVERWENFWGLQILWITAELDYRFFMWSEGEIRNLQM